MAIKTINVRLSADMETRLSARLLASGMTRAQFVREAIAKQLDQPAADESAPSAFELGRHLMGAFDSGRSDLSTNGEAIIREKLRDKHRRR